VLKSQEGVHVRGERNAKPKGQQYSDSTISTMEAIDETKLNYKLMQSLIAHICGSNKEGQSDLCVHELQQCVSYTDELLAPPCAPLLSVASA
jgi:hypothetical protein